jgi:ABC-type uncharacterized transport system permease subunit
MFGVIQAGMASATVFSLAAALCMVPAAAASLWGPFARDGRFWALAGAGAVGATSWAAVQARAGWETGFAEAIWVTVAGALLIFLLLAALLRHAWRLSPILLPYLVLLALLATIWSHAPPRPLIGQAPPAWIVLHIAASVITYVLLTLAAIAGMAVLLQERALRRKKRYRLTERLPSVADAERLELRLLLAAEAVLGVGILSGMATQYFSSGAILTFEHKTVLTIGAFLVIGALLVAHYRVGLRGRRAARVVLAGYLLVTLGYPGVKFVTDVLL